MSKFQVVCKSLEKCSFVLHTTLASQVKIMLFSKKKKKKKERKKKYKLYRPCPKMGMECSREKTSLSRFDEKRTKTKRFFKRFAYEQNNCNPFFFNSFSMLRLILRFFSSFSLFGFSQRIHSHNELFFWSWTTTILIRNPLCKWTKAQLCQINWKQSWLQKHFPEYDLKKRKENLPEMAKKREREKKKKKKKTFPNVNLVFRSLFCHRKSMFKKTHVFLVFHPAFLHVLPWLELNLCQNNLWTIKKKHVKNTNIQVFTHQTHSPLRHFNMLQNKTHVYNPQQENKILKCPAFLWQKYLTLCVRFLCIIMHARHAQRPQHDEGKPWYSDGLRAAFHDEGIQNKHVYDNDGRQSTLDRKITKSNCI